jgi:hypothetical protein
LSKETEWDAGTDSLATHLHETTDWPVDRCMRIAKILSEFGEPEWDE